LGKGSVTLSSQSEVLKMGVNHFDPYLSEEIK
jgi:hypothetical protein